MTERACALCTRRHETGNAAAGLQCRALPPIQGVARDAQYPTVRPDFYCHVHFEPEGSAQARDIIRGEPVEGLPDVELPPAGDEPPVVGAAESAAPPKRARRARADDAQLL